MNQDQINLLLDLDGLEWDIFSIEELKKALSCKYENLIELIENLVNKKIISRIERGKYCRANFRNELVIGGRLVPDGAIAYWSALNLHGLTEQFPNTIFIQTSHRKNKKNIFGVSYLFIQTKQEYMNGFIINGYGNHQYRITDKAKTILDCFYQPQYSGGYAELIRAFYQTELDVKKMITYAKAINNIAVIKRMGYIAELTKKEGFVEFIEFAKTQINNTYTLIDPFGSERGEFVPEWKLRLNIAKDRIEDIVNITV